MMFKGTFGNDEADNVDEEIRAIKFAERDIPLIARAFGADYNAFTTSNMTSYYFQCAPEFLKPFLQVLASSMDRTRLADQHARSEKLAVIEEMYAGKDVLMRDAIKSMRKSMYRHGDPSYHPTIGYESNLIDMSSRDLRGFYDRLYHPENATLFIVGKIRDVDKVKAWVEELFSPVRKKATAQTFDYTAPLKSRGATPAGAVRSRHMSFHTLSKSLGVMVVAWKHVVDEYRHRGKLREDVPKVLSKIMAGGANSRLYKEVVVNGLEACGTCNSVEMFTDLDYHVGETYVVLTGDTEMVDNADAWAAALQRLVTQPLTTRDVQVANAYLDQQRAARNVNLEGYVSAWVEDHHMTRDFSTFVANDVNDLVINDAESFIGEAFNSKPFVWTYTAFSSQEEAEGKAREVAEEHMVNVARLKRNARTLPLEPPHALPLFERRYRKVDLSKSLPSVTTQAWGKWTLVQNDSYSFPIRLAMMPLRHEALAMAGVDTAIIGQLQDVMRECFEKDKYEDAGVFGDVGPKGLRVRSLYDTDAVADAVAEFSEVFGTALDEDQEADLRSFWRRNGERFEKQWKQQSAEMGMDASNVCFDFVEDAVSDSKYASLSEVQAALTSFDVDKAIKLQRKWWTEVSGFIMRSRPIPDGIAEPEKYAHVGADHLDARLPPPAQASSAPVQREFKLSNVPLNQVVVVFGKPGTMTKSDSDYDGVRPVAQHIMFASLGSRFMKHMREGTGNVYYCGGWYGKGASFTHKGYDGLVIKSSPGEQDAVRKRVEDFIRTPVTVEDYEVAAAKRYLVHAWKQALSESALMGTWVRHWRQDCKAFERKVEEAVVKISAVTRADVEQFINIKADTRYNAVAIGV